MYPLKLWRQFANKLHLRLACKSTLWTTTDRKDHKNTFHFLTRFRKDKSKAHNSLKCYEIEHIGSYHKLHLSAKRTKVSWYYENLIDRERMLIPLEECPTANPAACHTLYRLCVCQHLILNDIGSGTKWPVGGHYVVICLCMPSRPAINNSYQGAVSMWCSVGQELCRAASHHKYVGQCTTSTSSGNIDNLLIFILQVTYYTLKHWNMLLPSVWVCLQGNHHSAKKR